MNIHELEVGLPVLELDTPVLLLDIAAVERNIQKMANFARQAGVALRPHAKIYKGTPIFAWMQLKAGAIGGGVRAVIESSGISNILTKSLGSNNPHNLVKAAIDGLSQLRTSEQVAGARGIREEEATA